MIFQRLQPADAAHLPAKRLLPHGAGGHEEGRRRCSAPGSCWSWWACRTRQTPTPPSSPAASSSAWPLPAPWPPSPRCCCATRPPAPWTPTPPSPDPRAHPGASTDKLGITVVVITHQMSVVEEICTHVAILDGGEVAEEGDGQQGVRRAPSRQPARRLVFPDGCEQTPLVSDPGQQRVRLIFNGANARPRTFHWWPSLAAEESISPPTSSPPSTQQHVATRSTAVCCWASPAAAAGPRRGVSQAASRIFR